MARPLRIQYNGAFYHVSARGNEKKRIYFSNSDYEKFKHYINKARDKYKLVLHCYVLMINHYHLILETPNANLDKIMHYINSSYTNYVNRKMKRSGHLLQGRYKAILIDQDSYLLELSRYVHLNPVRAGMVQKPEDYPHSSYGSFISNRRDDIVYRDLILGIISKNENKSMRDYKHFAEDAIGKKIDTPLKKIYGGAIAGGDKFIGKVLGQLVNADLDKEDISNRRELKSKYKPEEILEKVSSALNVEKDRIVNGEVKHCRSAAIYLIKKYTGLSNREIGRIFGNLSYSGVSKVYRRFEEKIETDSSLKRKVIEIMSNVKG